MNNDQRRELAFLEACMSTGKVYWKLQQAGFYGGSEYCDEELGVLYDRGLVEWCYGWDEDGGGPNHAWLTEKGIARKARLKRMTKTEAKAAA